MSFLSKILATPKYKMDKTYEVWDHDALDAGATDDSGFEYEDHEFDSLWDLAKELRDSGATEPSSHPTVNKTTYYSTRDAEEDHKSGDKTYYAFHPTLSSDAEAAELLKLIKMDQSAFNKARPD